MRNDQLTVTVAQTISSESIRACANVATFGVKTVCIINTGIQSQLTLINIC